MLSTFLSHTLCGLFQSSYILDKLGYGLRKCKYKISIKSYENCFTYKINYLFKFKYSPFASLWHATGTPFGRKRSGVRGKALQIFKSKKIIDKSYTF